MVGVRCLHEDGNTDRAIRQVKFDVRVLSAHVFQGVHDSIKVLLNQGVGIVTDQSLTIVTRDRDGA